MEPAVCRGIPYRAIKARRKRSTSDFTEGKSFARSWVIRLLEQFEQNCLKIWRKVFLFHFRKTGFESLSEYLQTLLLFSCFSQYSNQTNFMQQPSWEPYTSSASLEIPHFLRNPEARCHVHTSQPLVPILMHISSVRTFPSSFSNIHFNIILPYV